MKTRSPLASAFVLTLPLLGVLAAIVLWNPPGNIWKSVEFPKAQAEAYDARRLETESALSVRVYDRTKLDRLVREPQNMASNLAYVIAGVAIARAGRRPMTRSLGWACILLGVGSGLYHASLLPEWRMVDIIGVYVALFSLLLVGFAACNSAFAAFTPAWVPPVLAWAFGTAAAISRNDVRLFGIKPFDSTYTVVGAVTAGLVLSIVALARAKNRRRSVKTLFVGAGCTAIAFAGGHGDRWGHFWAIPDSPIQGHAIWHVMTAAALVATYEIFSDTGLDRSTLRT